MPAWGETTTNVLPSHGVTSLSWHGDVLIDWASGGTRFSLDGEGHPRRFLISYPFDASIASPTGDFAVAYQKLGTKGVLFHEGQIIRELNRSFYQANMYEYPVCLFERDGRTLLAHCPTEYNLIEIEDALTFTPACKSMGLVDIW